MQDTAEFIVYLNQHSKILIKSCGVSDTEMLVQWNVNVHALLKLKRIPNNEYFGVHNVPKQVIKSSATNR